MALVNFVASGDPHLCIDVQCPAGRHPETFYDEQRGKLKFIRDYCRDNSIPFYLIPGDLLNYKNPSVYTSTAINSLMAELVAMKEVVTLATISGNHDLKMSSREMKAKSVYNIFAEPGVITDVNHKTIMLGEGVTLTGIDYNHSKESLLNEVRLLNDRLNPKDINVVMLHEHLLPGDESLPFGQHINYSEFLGFKNINVIVSGHLHKGYPTETVGSFDIDNDEEGHSITFVNPWSLTRVARDHYALGDSHKPEIVHLTVDTETREITFKHVTVPHKSFDEAFVKQSLVSEEKQELDISEFVSGLADFEQEDRVSVLDMKSRSQEVRNRIEHYTTLAEQQLG